MPEIAVLLVVTLTLVLAGFVKGVIGLGMPTVSMGLLGAVMRPAEAAALLVMPTLVTNIWQLLAGPSFAGLLRRLWPMMAGICAGTLAGQWADLGLSGGNTAQTAALLGGALILYALVGLTRIRFRVPPAAEPWAGPLAGAVTGLISGATGVFVIPAVPYLQAIGLDKDDLIQALGLTFTVATLALAAGLAGDGFLGGSAALASLLALAPALAGMSLGGRVRAAINPEAFRRWFFVGLLGLGAHLSARWIW